MRLVRLIPLVLLSLAACKQGEGGRCQLSTDCESPLVCSTAEPRVCLPTGEVTTADAAPGVDSRFDARLFDASTAPVPDAAVPDAAVPDAALPDAALPDASL